MLHHHDSVGAPWYWRSGHNPNRSARLQRMSLPLFPGPYLPGNLQWTTSEIRSPHGKSIPRRPVERRLIPIGMDSFGKHPILRGEKRYKLRRRRCQTGRLRQHHRKRLIEADNANRSLAHLVLLKCFGR
jgi:hypothetical protein